MIKVAGAWEMGWNTPLQEFDLWNFPLRSFEVDEWYMAPVTGISKRVTEIADVLEVLELNPTMTPIFLDERGDTPLREFVHPVNALYVLGRAGYSPWRANNCQGESVIIETPVPGGMLWPHQCIAIALYDRVSKP